MHIPSKVQCLYRLHRRGVRTLSQRWESTGRVSTNGNNRFIIIPRFLFRRIRRRPPLFTYRHYDGLEHACDLGRSAILDAYAGKHARTYLLDGYLFLPKRSVVTLFSFEQLRDHGSYSKVWTTIVLVARRARMSSQRQE